MRIKNGVIAEIYNDKDYELAGGLTINDIPKAKYSFWDKQIQYHQPDVSEMSCTLFGCLTAFSNLTGYIFSFDEQMKLWNQAKDLGASDKAGWYLYKAVDLVRGYVNSLKMGTFLTFKVGIGYDEFYNVTKNGYMVITGYNGNAKWNQDRADGILSGTSFGESTYSHIMNFADKSPETKDELYIIDSYKKTSPANIYQIPNIIPLYQNNTIFKYGYVFATEAIKAVLDPKLTARFDNRLIYNTETKEYAQILNGKKIIFTGGLADTVNKLKWKGGKESYTCGVTNNDWVRIGE